MPPLGRYVCSQNGYTLIELIIATSIGAVLLVGLSSIILTSVRAGTTASSRVQASGQIRSFEFFAGDDFARSSVPITSECGTPDNPCTTQPIVLAGTQVSNSTRPVPAAYAVSYTWGQSGFIDRQVGVNPSQHAAGDVSSFSWYVEGSSPNQSVVVNLTVTVSGYSESQTLRFYPRISP